MLSAEQINVTLGPSKWFCLLVLTAVGAGLAALADTAVDVRLRIALAFALVLSLADTALRDALRRHPEAVVWVSCQRGGWHLGLRGGAAVEARLTEPLIVTPYFVSLRFRCKDGRRRTVNVFPDALDASAFRRLRVLLRFNRSGAE